MAKRILMGVLLSVAAVQAADVSSLIFYDLTHDATKAVPSGEVTNRAFNLGRAYVTVSGAPSENIAYKLQFDAGQLKSYTLKDAAKVLIDTDGDTLSTKTYSLSSSDAGFYAYVKSANVEWSTGLGKWILGVQGMNLFNVQENTFGNRFLEKPLMDAHGFSSSADLGLGYTNKFADLVTASVLYTNGGGYKKAESDKYKKLSLQVVAGETALNKKDGWNAGLVFSMEPYQQETTKKVEDKTALGLFGGWAGAGLRVGAEFDMLTTTAGTKKLDRTFVDKKDQIIGLYGDYKLPFAPGFAVFGQVDLYDPHTEEVENDPSNDSTTGYDESKNNETTITAGAKWAPVKGLVIAPNLRMTSYEDSNKDSAVLYRLNFEFKI